MLFLITFLDFPFATFFSTGNFCVVYFLAQITQKASGRNLRRTANATDQSRESMEAIVIKMQIPILYGFASVRLALACQVISVQMVAYILNGVQ